MESQGTTSKGLKQIRFGVSNNSVFRCLIENIGLAKKFAWVFPCHLTEKPKPFRPTQYVMFLLLPSRTNCYMLDKQLILLICCKLNRRAVFSILSKIIQTAGRSWQELHCSHRTFNSAPALLSVLLAWTCLTPARLEHPQSVKTL